MNKLSRRSFIKIACASAAALPACISKPENEGRVVQTVLGPIPAGRLGRTLPHEHVICDFIGADQTGKHRWNVEEVVSVMQPYLEALKKREFTGFIDCTPAYIGRDPRILKHLAELTGVHIVTNTGYYGGAGDKFVPKHAYSESAEELATRWIKEWDNGIEGSGVRPGFLKIGVDEAKGVPPALSEIDAKIVRASAIASRKTKLSVVCHTGGGPAGLAATKLFIAEGGAPNRFIVAHSDGHGLHINEQVAELGAWVSFDGVSRRPLEQHLKLVAAMLEKHPSRLLISHDNGWYEAGKPGGGKIRDFNYMADTFIPALINSGISEEMVNRLIIANPANAIAI